MSFQAPAAQRFVSPSGDEMVIIPRAEYDRLVALAVEAEEDAEDIATYDRAKTALAAGTDII
uniref:hypothetical protein n=1 Tax=Serratia marcescens TaxID=615 RepID=UPI001952E01C